MKKITAMILVLCILLTLSACGMAEPETIPTEATTAPTTEATAAPTTEPTTVPTEPEPEVFTLTFVGDCTLGSVPDHFHTNGSFVQTIGTDYDYPFRNVVEYFENDDFTMVNLEGVLGDAGYPAQKTFTFRGPAEYVNILTGSSVEAVTLANNHSLDFGERGYNATKDILDEADVTYVEKDGSALFTTESGLTIGLYAASFNIYQEDLAAEVAALREQGADIVVFAVHWGTEGAYRPHAHQIQQAYDAIDAGVDIVYGSHPHVLQKIEEYNGGIIYFSLGNFCFGGNHYPPDLDSVVLQQEVIREADGTVHLGALTIIPCSVSSLPVQNNFQPTPYEEGSEEYERAMSKLNGTWTGSDLYVDYGGGDSTPETQAPTEAPSEAPTETPTEAPSQGGSTEGGTDSGDSSDSGSSGTETPAPEPTPEPAPEPTPTPDPVPTPDPAPDTGSET